MANPDKVNYEDLLQSEKVRDITLPAETFDEGLDVLGRNMNRGGADVAFYDGNNIGAFGEDDPLTEGSKGWAEDLNRLTAVGTVMHDRAREVIKYNKRFGL